MKRPFESVIERATPPNNGRASRFFNFAGSVVYSPVSYVPQVIAIWLGNAAGLSVESIVLLGRFFNSVLSILLVYLAIRITPVGDLALLWVGLLPMTAAASAAFGQDGLAIGEACLLAAVGLRAVLNGPRPRSEMLITALLTISMGLSKVLYLPVGMVGGQPFIQRDMRWRRLVPPLAICVAGALLAALWLHAVSGLMVPARAGLPPPADRVAVWLHNPAALPALFEHTYVTHGVDLLDSLFLFGWVNVGPVRAAACLSIAALVLVIIAGDSGAGELNWQTRGWLLVIAAFIAALITVTIDLYWTRPSHDWAQGFQARYLIPIAPLLIIPLLPKRRSDAQHAILVAGLMVVANLLALKTIVGAYYL